MGLERDVSQDEIKRVYRKLARKYHPDVSKEEKAEERFKEVGEAYEVLKDPEKRAAYDQLSKNWKAGQDFTPPPEWDAGFEFSGGPDASADASAFSEFFASLFGHDTAYSDQQHGGGVQGEDHHARIIIDIEDAYHGSQRSITLNSPKIDTQGRLIIQERTLNVKIPKGISAGQRIRLAGQGTPSINGGQGGDLFLEIEFKPHSLYKVDGRDISIELPVTPWEAVLGATVTVPIPGGKVQMTIPEGSSGGRSLRLKGKGIPGKIPGDLYVILHISLPPAENEQSRELYRRMKETMSFNPRHELGV